MEPTAPRRIPDPDREPTPEQLERLLRGLFEDRSHEMRQMPPMMLPVLLMHAVYVLLCMSYLSMWRSEVFAGVFLLISAAMGIMTLRSPWIIGMLSVPAFLLIMATNRLAVAALPIAVLGAAAYGAFLILTAKRSPWLIVLPALAFAMGLGATGDVSAALLAWLPLPAAVVLAYVLYKGMHRVRAICRVAVALVVPILLVGLLGLLLREGADAPGNLASAVSSARHALAERLAAWEVGTGEDAGRVVLEGMEFALAGAVFNILPGFALAVLAVCAYLTDLICLTLFRTYERTKYLSRRVWVFAISLPAALVFLVSYLVLLMLGGGIDSRMQFAAVIAENIYLALMPAMLFAGALNCIRTFLLSSHRLMLLIAAILFLALAPGAVLTVVSLLGAGNVVWQTAWRTWKRRKKTDGDGWGD